MKKKIIPKKTKAREIITDRMRESLRFVIEWNKKHMKKKKEK